MIEKVKEKFRDNPTWLGVSILSAFIIAISVSVSVFASKYIAERAVNDAVGNRIDQLGELLERFEKLTISQTQNVNVGGDAEKLRDKRLRDLHAERGNLGKE